VIAVIGAAGTVGRHVVAFLARWRVETARRDARLKGEERVDAGNADSVAAALADASVCVNCVAYRFNVPVMRGCLAAGVHYVDLGGLYHVTREQLELDEDFRRAGLSAILGLGSAPGKTNLLAAAAARRLGEDPRSLEIWAASRDPAAADHPFPAPYSVRTLLDEVQLRPIVLRGGDLSDVEPLSGGAERDFPEPVGRARGIYTLHSELATLPGALPSLHDASFRLCLPPGLLEKLLALPEGEEPEPYVQSSDAVAVHLVELRNSKTVVGMTITRGGSARSTAEPAARGAVEIAAGRLAAPGVHAPEAAISDPERYLALLDTEVRFIEH
jgi:saccharopine dehydrogenase-like NADP-dependent oxidoreductase